MIKNALITLVIATAVTLFAPRDLDTVATLAMRAGIELIKLGLALERRGYDAGLGYWHDDSDPQQPLQDADFKASTTRIMISSE